MNIKELISMYSTRTTVLARILQMDSIDIQELVDNMAVEDEQYATYDSVDNPVEAIITMLEEHNLYIDAMAYLS